jgi:glycosyltransferase involved in cell wall biosynthesis
MIRLGINLTDFKKNYRGGINSFALGLLQSLERKKILLNIYTNKDSKVFLKKIFSKSNIIIINNFKLIYLILQFFCIIFGDKKKFVNLENAYYKKIKKKIEQSCDVFYCPLSYLKPFNLKIPTVSSIHDLQHLHYPDNFNFLQYKYRNFSFEETIKKSTVIQASSLFIKKDIKKFYPNIKNKIEVIHEGVSSDFKFKKTKSIKKNYIFFPAQLWRHKNHIIVFKAIKILKEKYNLNIRLILVGQKFSYSKNIFNFINNNKNLDIVYLGKVKFKKLIKLYTNCKFLISPAIYESSSIPILEACKIGRPIICSNTGPNKELGLKLKLNFFETNNPRNLSIVIKKLWNKDVYINKQINFNKRIIGHYDWNNVSNYYQQLFESLNNRSKKTTL